MGGGGRRHGETRQEEKDMPVWVSTDAKLDLNKDGVQRRHISESCPVYHAEVPTTSRSPLKGRPNTARLQERTARCEHDKCWVEWEKTATVTKKRSTGGKASSKGAATTPAKSVGGKAADLAAKAKAARQQPMATAAVGA